MILTTAARRQVGPKSPTISALGWVLIVLTGFLLVAHGCHGSDADHEPAVAPQRIDE